MRVLKWLAGLVALWLVAAYTFGPLEPTPTAANRPAMPAGGWPAACLDTTAQPMAGRLNDRPDPRDTAECRRALPR